MPIDASTWALSTTAAVAVLVVVLAGAPVRWLARRLGAIDVPGGRHQHRCPTPRLGGLAVLAGVLTALPIGAWQLASLRPEVVEQLPALGVILLAAVLVALLGAVDDCRSISPVAKLLGLAAAGAVLIAGGVQIDVVELPWLGKLPLGPFAAIATILWVLACSNAVNLIDGVDGLGSGVALVACAALALVAHGLGDTTSTLAFVGIAAACAGFLVHNREPARLFLGDSGSLLLGFLLAALSANGCTKRTTAVLLVAATCTLAVPLLDSTQAFVRRFRRAARDGSARFAQRLRATAVGDREHIHHRLLVRGMSHRQVARTLSLCAAVPATTALLLLPTGALGALSMAAAVLASACVLWRLAALRAPAATPTPRTDRQPVLLPRPGDVLVPASPPRPPRTAGHVPVLQPKGAPRPDDQHVPS